jgi:hypothetical protein
VIHVHPAVLENARVRYDTEPEGPFTFKGKALPQVVYRVGDELGPKEATTATVSRSSAGRPSWPPFAKRIEAVGTDTAGS